MDNIDSNGQSVPNCFGSCPASANRNLDPKEKLMENPNMVKTETTIDQTSYTLFAILLALPMIGVNWIAFEAMHTFPRYRRSLSSRALASMHGNECIFTPVILGILPGTRVTSY